MKITLTEYIIIYLFIFIQFQVIMIFGYVVLTLLS